MTTDSERLARMERRQEALIQATSSLIDTVRITNAMVAELMDWLKEPPSSDVSDLLKAILARLEDLPERVAKAVLDRELDGRG